MFVVVTADGLTLPWHVLAWFKIEHHPGAVGTVRHASCIQPAFSDI